MSNTDNLIRVVGRDGAPDPAVHEWVLWRPKGCDFVDGWEIEVGGTEWNDTNEWIPFTPPTEYLTSEPADEVVERYSVEARGARYYICDHGHDGRGLARTWHLDDAERIAAVLNKAEA